MRLRSWRGTQPLSTSTRRPFPWVRLTLFLAVVGVLAYIFVPDFYYIRADALVQGSLVPVTPIYRVRIDDLLVSCNDRVRAGQPVAIVSNFLVQADYQREYLNSQQQEQLSQISLDQNVAEARENAETLHQRYIAAESNLQRVQQTLGSYQRAYAQGAVSRIEWQDKEAEVATDQADASSAQEAWQRAQERVNVIERDANEKIASDQELATQAQSLAQQVSKQPLFAPVTGYIVDCVERPQNVIDPGVHLFDIYSPDRAYILAYFSPNSVTGVQLGERARISIAGVPHDVIGHVVAIYPDLDKLPSQLTKFFWQHVQFSEFRPVKIAIDTISKADREKLYYDAQARVYIDRHPRTASSAPAVSVHQ
jgi:multidrug resistance efflux pump